MQRFSGLRTQRCAGYVPWLCVISHTKFLGVKIKCVCGIFLVERDGFSQNPKAGQPATCVTNSLQSKSFQINKEKSLIYVSTDFGYPVLTHTNFHELPKRNKFCEALWSICDHIKYRRESVIFPFAQLKMSLTKIIPFISKFNAIRP